MLKQIGKTISSLVEENLADEEREDSKSSSEFQVKKTKKIRRKMDKKRETKIIHTTCLFYTHPDGKKEIITYQKIGHTFAKDPQAINDATQKMIQEQDKQVIEENKKRTDFCQTQQSQADMFNWAPEHYYQNQMQYIPQCYYMF